MKKIGIVPSARLFETNDPYMDQYLFVNAYVKRVAKNGGIPLGILGEDGYLPPGVLDLCDAFLLCGGRKMWPYHIQVVEHAHRTGKKVLGICLGMQAIAAYFCVLEERGKRRFSGTTTELFMQMKQEKYLFTLPVAHHWDFPLTREDMETAKHPVNIRKGSRLHALLEKEQINAATLHHYQVNGVPNGLSLSALALDGTVEGLEFQDQMLGVQFHPEIDGELDALFIDLMR